jgi:predicted O-methyltransferase YrrM
MTKLELRSFADALQIPLHMSSPAPWAGHTPFAMWLMARLQPRLFVELGAYSGISYLAFCQSVREHNLSTQCVAVDTWQGDAHAGFYSDAVYETLKSNHDDLYGHFSTLMRKTFDAAVSEFSDGSIDLLHIDGLHTYDAVRHDFETWLPKLSSRGVVLFHDTAVRKDDFGVYQFWDEITLRYPGFSFEHSHGLGVLFVGAEASASSSFLGLDITSPEETALLRSFFSALGAAQEHRVSLMVKDHELMLKMQELGATQHELRELQSKHESLAAASDQQHQWILKLDSDILSYQQKINYIESSISCLCKLLFNCIRGRLR